MLLYKQKKKKKNDPSKGRRFLISVTVFGSAGPIRMVVNEDELVGAVIATALKSYAREGRLPILGSDLNNFTLFCPLSGSGGLNPWETIGSAGVRNFMLCEKLQNASEGEKSPGLSSSRKRVGNWKTWFNKSFNRKISSH